VTGAVALTEVVAAKSQLKELSLASNRLGPNGGLAFSKMLEQVGPGKLQRLNLSANGLNGTSRLICCVLQNFVISLEIMWKILAPGLCSLRSRGKLEN
jgi:hypothetical protein